MKFRSNVRGPWGPAGTEIEMKEPTKTQERYIHLGYLERIDEPGDENVEPAPQTDADPDKNEDEAAESDSEGEGEDKAPTKRRRRSS